MKDVQRNNAQLKLCGDISHKRGENFSKGRIERAAKMAAHIAVHRYGNTLERLAKE